MGNEVETLGVELDLQGRLEIRENVPLFEVPQCWFRHRVPSIRTQPERTGKQGKQREIYVFA